MLNKLLPFILSIMMLITSLSAEIIKTSKLSKKIPAFKITRDLFSPKRTVREAKKMKFLERQENLRIKDDKLKQKHEETFEQVMYEGFVTRKNHKVALLSVSGEFITAKKGDIVLEKITIIEISDEILKIKMENKIYDIPLKGDEDEE